MKNIGLTYYLVAYACFTISGLKDLVMFYLGINISEEITSGVFALITLSLPIPVVMHTMLPDVTATMKKKLDVDFRNYRVLGACNPSFALKALEAEDKIGTMLPCNVIVQERGENEIEIAAVDPVSSMQAVKNDALGPIAIEIRNRLQRVVKSLA